jgi:hypothetical protein
MLAEYPNLSGYVAAGEARPAYKRAFEGQLRCSDADDEDLPEVGG